MSDRARIMLFDIESTGLNASFGSTLCFGYKYLGDKTAKVLSIADYPEVSDPASEPDKHLLKHVHRLLTDEADIIITFYGKEFDRKFLNTRMLMVGLPLLPPLSSEHIDLYFTARGNLRLHSNRLQAVSESLGCPEQFRKSSVSADIWRKAQRGHQPSMKYIIEHCRLDVDCLEWCYLKLRPFVRQHPPVSSGPGCRNCGGMSQESKGRRFRMGRVDRRLRCRGCGRWSYRNIDNMEVKA